MDNGPGEAPHRNSLFELGWDGFVQDAEGRVLNDRYLVLKKLGQGSFSTVWLCRDKIRNKNAAVKVLRNCEELLEKGRLEFELYVQVQSLDDPAKERVVTPLAAFMLEGSYGPHYAMALEVMEGDLEFFNATTHMPYSLVKEMSRQVLQGLVLLHYKCGVIHGDLKPNNILFTGLGMRHYAHPPLTYLSKEEMLKFEKVHYPDLRFKISDLGSAVHRARGSRRLLQAYAYRALEVMVGSYDHSSADIWSMGCVIFEMATGEMLFEGQPESLSKKASIEQVCRVFGKLPTGILNHLPFEVDDIGIRDPFQNLPGLLQYPDELRRFKEFLLPMFNYDWSLRITAEECLKQPWLMQT